MHIWPLSSAVLVAGRRCFSKNPSMPAGNPGAKAAKTEQNIKNSGLFRLESVHQSSLIIYGKWRSVFFNIIMISL